MHFSYCNQSARYESSRVDVVYADGNLLTIIMENVDDLRTLYHLVIALLTAKTIFDRYPRQLLTANLEALPWELEEFEVPYVAAADLRISTDLSDPSETLMRLAAAYVAIEDLASGLVE